MTVKDLREFIFKNYYKRVGFTQKVIKISKKEKRFSIIRY